MGFGLIRGGLTLHLADGAVEHLGVELEANRLDVSALLATQEITRTAQFQIEGRNLEAGPQVGKFFQCGQAPARDGSELDFSRQQQIRVIVRPLLAGLITPDTVIIDRASNVGALDFGGT